MQKIYKQYNPEGFKYYNGNLMLSTCHDGCNSKKNRFIKKQHTSEILSSLAVKAPLSKIALSGDILLWMQIIDLIVKNIRKTKVGIFRAHLMDDQYPFFIVTNAKAESKNVDFFYR